MHRRKIAEREDSFQAMSMSNFRNLPMLLSLPLRRPMWSPLSSSASFADTALDGEESVEEEAEREELRPEERGGEEPPHPPAIGRKGPLGNGEGAANSKYPNK